MLAYDIILVPRTSKYDIIILNPVYNRIINEPGRHVISVCQIG